MLKILILILPLLSFANDPVAISKGLVSTPLTLISCRSGNDLGVACELDLKGHRGRDERLLKIKALGIEESGYFTGTIHYARSAQELNNLSQVVKPGDQIVLRNAGDWNNAKINFKAYGLKSRPILIRGESKAIFTGESSFTASGEHIILKNIKFIDAVATQNNIQAIRLGTSSYPCNNCILMDSAIDNFNSTEADRSKVRYHYVIVAGKDVTIAYSKFTNHVGNGNMISAGWVPQVGSLRLHLLRNYFADRPKVTIPDRTNGFEILFLGGSANGEHQSYSLIENNMITRADGEGEIMTIKLSDIIIRNNTFRDNQGTLTLRHSDRTLIEGNFFMGLGRDLTGGLRVIGRGHVIVNNHFEGLKIEKRTNTTYWPLSIRTADLEELTNNLPTYSRVKNTLVANNTFYNCNRGVHLTGGLSSTYPLLAENVTFVNNIFSHIENAPVFYSDDQRVFQKLNFKKNLFRSNLESGLPDYVQKQLYEASPLVRASGDIARLNPMSLGLNYGEPLRSIFKLTDLNGALSPSKFSIGNDDYGQLSTGPKRKPFTSVTQVFANN